MRHEKVHVSFIIGSYSRVGQVWCVTVFGIPVASGMPGILRIGI